MTLQQLLLLYLFSVLSIPGAEKLPQHRKSCSHQKILIESSNFSNKHIDWSIPTDKWHIFKEECHRVQYRPTRSLRTTLPSGPVFRGFLRDNNDRTIADPVVFRDAVRTLLLHKQLQRTLSNELINLLELKNHSEPHIRLGSTVSSAKCFGNENSKTIQITVQLMLPDELLIWKCEDIGRIKDDVYEFYNLSPVWMVEDDNGNTFKINLHRCLQNQFNQTFCPPDVKAYYNATCSINNVDTCVKTYVKPKMKDGSYIRALPGGISIYGTFKTLSKRNQSKNRTNGTKPHEGFSLITPGLYYFVFNNSTLPITSDSIIVPQTGRISAPQRFHYGVRLIPKL